MNTDEATSNIRATRASWAGAAALLASLWAPGSGAATVPAWPLNDTGFDWWADGSQNFLTAPPSGYPGQDASYGRDASRKNDADGHAGFSFAKLDASGKALPASATAWSCVRDNITGLIWEIKTDDDGLRDLDWFYSWYNPDGASNGGEAGRQNHGYCSGEIDCDTLGFVQAVNQAGLCGAKDWRLPNRQELLSIADRSRVYTDIDTAYFPDAVRLNVCWSSSPYAGYSGYAWVVNVAYGYFAFDEFKDNPNHVRLVRGGQALSFATTIGVWRPGTRQFLLDQNGNRKWDDTLGGDTLTAAFGAATDLPVAGDWSGGGKAKIGVWRPSTRQFLLDKNGNGKWDGTAGGDTLTAAFGATTARPVAGDWSGNGKAKVGVWHPNTRQFLLDKNGNGKWDGTAGGDTLTTAFGLATDRPVVGDWSGNGKAKVGVWRPSTRQFLLDKNGNGKWDGTAGGDLLTAAFGAATDLPVAGDWNSDRKTEIGVWRPSTRQFLLDKNGNGKWDGTAGGDALSATFGAATDLPVTGWW